MVSRMLVMTGAIPTDAATIVLSAFHRPAVRIVIDIAIATGGRLHSILRETDLAVFTIDKIMGAFVRILTGHHSALWVVGGS